MFDNLRDDASESFYEETDIENFPEDKAIAEKPVAPKPKRKAATGRKFLGMTPVQRFIIAFMLMVAVCALGSMCLLMTGKIGLV